LPESGQASSTLTEGEIHGSENQASIRVAERIGESLQGCTDLYGREMLRYGLDCESYVGMLAA